MKNQFVTSIDIPDGKYEGFMSGYSIQFQYKDKEVFYKTSSIGIRGLNVPVQFTVKDNAVDESTIK